MEQAKETKGLVVARSAALIALIGAFAFLFRPAGAHAALPSALAIRAHPPAIIERSAPIRAGVEVAVLSEENLPAENMPTPTPAATPSAAASAGAASTPAASTPSPTPAQNESSNQDNWVRVPSAASAPSPAAGAPAASQAQAQGAPGEQAQAGQIGAASGAGGMPSPEASPTEVPPAYDVGSMQPAPLVSDQPLTPLIDAAAKDQPALAASLRYVERARKALKASKPDEAIRALGPAVSIDSSDPYAYFYLGRAYMMKNDYAEALAFFGRSEVGFLAIPAWLGEVKTFEGACLEEQGKLAQALQAYKAALEATPNNLMARVGYGRLSAVASDANAGNEPPPLAPAASAALPPPASGAAAPPPEDATAVASPPKEVPPAPAQSDPGNWTQTPAQSGGN